MPNSDAFAISSAWIIANVWSALIALIVLIAGWILAKFLSDHITRLLPRPLHRDQTIAPLVSQVVRYGVLLVTVIIVLGQFGVQTASILAVLGAAGLAVALALQGTLSNIAAGILLIFLRPFNVGDNIDADGIVGSVVEVGLFATQMRTPEGVYMFAPNSKLSNAKIINYSRQPVRAVEISINVPRSADIGRVRDTLLQAAASDYVLNDPAPLVRVESLGDAAVTVVLRAVVKSADWSVARSALQERVKTEVDTALAQDTFAPAV
ncbi:MAG: mechanosensitive ion channel protein [Devosia sp.]|nr:mechanosensitive ion channel protein [Devosia sp.]